LKKSQFEEIKSLKEKVSDQPIINFEVAYLNEQWNEVLELKSQVAMNDRRNNQIINALLHSGKEEEATQFAEQQGSSDLTKKVEDYQSKKKQIEDLKNQISDVQKNQQDAKLRENKVKTLNITLEKTEEELNKLVSI
jgi:uncharacterized protein YlxW (UPF0749 family)